MTVDQRDTSSDDIPKVTSPSVGAQQRVGRRNFLRGAALLAVGGLGTANTAEQSSQSLTAGAAAPPLDAADRLARQTQRALRWAGRDPDDWVRARSGVEHNVVIVGGGQSGLGIAYGLRRKGIGRVAVIDQASPGGAGIWRTVARMQQLRSLKTLPGPDLGNPGLSFRGWYETLRGPESFDALDRIPRLVWADYLDWFQQATDTTVRFRTRLLEIEPQGDVLRLSIESEGIRQLTTTRKLVLANGYLGAGGANVPGFIRSLPSVLWSHTATPIRFSALRGKVVGVIGAGASAFDAAATALENGAARVHLFSRRSYIDYPVADASSIDRGIPSFGEQGYELPDVVRWRNFVLGDQRVASVPLDTIQRVVALEGFHLHLDSAWSDVAVAGNG